MNPSLFPPSPPALPERILIVRLSAHGDVMHTLPLLSALKAARADLSIGWLVEASAAPLLQNHPLIDHLHVSYRQQWLNLVFKPWRWPKMLRELASLVRELREADYQAAFDAQGLLKSAVWPWLANIPVRYGYRASREQAARFYNRLLPPMRVEDASTPAVQRYLDFARALGCPPCAPRFVLPPVSPESRRKVKALLGSTHSEAPLVVLAPFTRWPSKHWPLDYWPVLMRELLALPVRLAVVGAPADAAAVVAMQAQLPAAPVGDRLVNLAGKTDWPDLYALFEQARLVIGLDSAPLHIANAVGRPFLIGLYGPTAPGRTGPVGDFQQTLSTALFCQPCLERRCPLKTDACMRQLTPEMVLAMAKRALGLPDEGGTP